MTRFWPRKRRRRRGRSRPAPAPAVEDSESDDTDGSDGSDESSSSSDDENRDEAANVVAEPKLKTKNQNCQNQNGAAGVLRGDAVRVEEEDDVDGAER